MGTTELDATIRSHTEYDVDRNPVAIRSEWVGGKTAAISSELVADMCWDPKIEPFGEGLDISVGDELQIGEVSVVVSGIHSAWGSYLVERKDRTDVELTGRAFKAMFPWLADDEPEAV
jgi:hypothetical protein